MAQRLAHQASPYLRQHASNPIDWWPWGLQPFAEARRLDLPVLVSIGYSSCHWCHVMAAETFSDPAVADLLNGSFLAIKVDREEHPDVDQAFMRATQALTGQGGWPNTVFCTPDGKPFFAGSYFPPEPRFGLPSFSQVVQTLGQAWQERRMEVLDSARLIVNRLASLDRPSMVGTPDSELAPDRLTELVLADADPTHGGFGTAPKFPQAPILDALFVRTDQAANDAALFALEAMSRGGICDQVGGGFHRYAVDEGWEVPHFEKMLYDNALLLGTYTRGWLRAIPDDGTEQREIFERVVRGIVGWLEDEMRLEGGAFASSLDADSETDTGEHAEGAYYLWSPQLFDEYLGKDSRFAQGVFHVTHKGNLPAGAHAPTDGSGMSTLQFHGLPHPGRVANITAGLKAIRERRPCPARDDKVVAAWNGLLIDSLVRAGMVFGEPTWRELARACGEYLWTKHWDPDRQILARASMATDEGITRGADGVCSDYACVALGFLSLAQAVDPGWMEPAVALLERAVELFSSVDGGFCETTALHPGLFERPKRLADEELPSTTSVMEVALRSAARLTGRRDLLARADAAAMSLRPLLASSPRSSGWGLASLLARSEAERGWGPAEVVIVDESDHPAASPLAQAGWRLAPWGSVIVAGAPGTTGFGDLFADRTELDDEPTAYVCRGQSCQLPVTDWSNLRGLLWETS
ncbi:thioredoxin domain-containing protein [Propionimicrobium sp. PCR01-08-3]|uniref:thioredoxin domain-containing protein n=1 Tax=Propionimicrobium sp. PCR01-08-3 TaxID=3052086 RepID=UPI00255C6DB1|nr:thioredoxin domain-containing protein [Propionimicrobium sp. PCR01-08-3]WIY81860.1 thioredoxin domain-containing protein [Propionimicrobium sp. PCR01-08-3]